MQSQGRKEVIEAVAIAALSALATGAINWAYDHIKATQERRRKAKEKPEEDDSNAHT